MIYIFLASGFEEIEALTTVDLLRRAELDVKTVGIGSKTIHGAHGITVISDIQEKDVVTDNLDAIVLPGGMPGTLNLEKSSIVTACVNYCNDNEKYIAAICAAPSILGHNHILDDKNATCFPGVENELYGANVVDDHICVDGHIITAKGPGVSIEFSLKIIEKLLNKEISNKIRMSIQCK